MTDFVIVGKIGGTYGVKGWLKVVSFTESVADILDYDPWFIEDPQGWRELKVSDAREHGKGVVAKFANLDNPEEARLWTGKKIAIKHTQLPVLEKQDYYWTDLEGLTVINETGEVLGTIVYLMATGSNDVLVVKGTKEFAIPYLPGEVVTKIDLAAKVMYVNWEMI